MNLHVSRAYGRRRSSSRWKYTVTEEPKDEDDIFEDNRAQKRSETSSLHENRSTSCIEEHEAVDIQQAAGHKTTIDRWSQDNPIPQIISEDDSGMNLRNVVFDPDGIMAYYWMGIVTISVLYNLAIIILRLTFTELGNSWTVTFYVLDTLSDGIYVLDIIIQFRLAYYDDGCLIVDPRKLSLNYRRQTRFTMDLLSTFPLQYMSSIVIGLVALFIQDLSLMPKRSIFIPVLRLPRLLKTFIVVRFFAVTDSRTSTPNRVRAIKLSLYLWLVIHWIGCIYYMVSEYEGRGSNDWVYPNGTEYDSFSRKYIRSLYWSMLILTTIGERPSPTTDLEYVFTGMTFVIGVFVFAAVVGNVGDVISNMNASRQDFQARMDQIKCYMNHRRVPNTLQNRVKRWAEYSWTRTQAIDEPHLLQLLPERLRTEIAIQVHLDTLKKVKIFEECEEGLLRELVLKLKPQIYSPNDYICRTGEIGRDMFIINHGVVEPFTSGGLATDYSFEQILVPKADLRQKTVVAKLVSGNYFGEISLLKLEGNQNRRTADVRSVGYSELLCLSRKDLTTALTEYPDAKKILEKIARERMLENTRRVGKTAPKKMESTSPASPKDFRKQKTHRKDLLYEVVKTQGFQNLLSKQDSDMKELKTVVNDLKLLYENMKLSRSKTSFEKARCLKRKLIQKDKELQIAQNRIRELEITVEVFQRSRECPCDGDTCISPISKPPATQSLRDVRIENFKRSKTSDTFKRIQHENGCSEISTDYISKSLTPSKSQTLPSKLQPQSPSTETFNSLVSNENSHYRKRTVLTSNQPPCDASCVPNINPSNMTNSNDVSYRADSNDYVKTSSGYSSDTETMATLLNASRLLKLRAQHHLGSLSDQSENESSTSESSYSSDNDLTDSEKRQMEQNDEARTRQYTEQQSTATNQNRAKYVFSLWVKETPV